MNPSMRSHPQQRVARRYYYAIGIILFLLGISLMLLPHALHKEGEFWRSLGEVGTFLALIVALHYIYELLIRKEDRQLWTQELATVLATQLSELKGVAQLSRASIHAGPEVAYAAVTYAITRTSIAKKGEKTLKLGALYDHSGNRKERPLEDHLLHQAFNNQMNQCIASSGPDKWYVKELYNITSEERLDSIVKRIEGADGAPGYEVRAFCLKNTIPQLTPLIVDNDELFIGWDDSTYYGINGVFNVHGQEFARGAAEYFDSLWNDRRTFILRSGLTTNIQDIDLLRDTIRCLSSTVSQLQQAQSVGTVLKDRSSYVSLNESIASASRVCFLGPTLINIFSQWAGYLHFTKLNEHGATIQAILINPDSSALDSTAQCMNEPPENFRRDVERSINHVQSMLEGEGIKNGSIELRLMFANPNVSMVLIDPDKPGGKIFVEFIGYHSRLHTRPHVELTLERDKEWYQYFVQQYDELWNDAELCLKSNS